MQIQKIGIDPEIFAHSIRNPRDHTVTPNSQENLSVISALWRSQLAAMEGFGGINADSDIFAMPRHESPQAAIFCRRIHSQLFKSEGSDP